MATAASPTLRTSPPTTFIAMLDMDKCTLAEITKLSQVFENPDALLLNINSANLLPNYPILHSVLHSSQDAQNIVLMSGSNRQTLRDELGNAYSHNNLIYDSKNLLQMATFSSAHALKLFKAVLEKLCPDKTVRICPFLLEDIERYNDAVKKLNSKKSFSSFIGSTLLEIEEYYNSKNIICPPENHFGTYLGSINVPNPLIPSGENKEFLPFMLMQAYKVWADGLFLPPSVPTVAFYDDTQDIIKALEKFYEERRFLPKGSILLLCEYYTNTSCDHTVNPLIEWRPSIFGRGSYNPDVVEIYNEMKQFVIDRQAPIGQAQAEDPTAIISAFSEARFRLEQQGLFSQKLLALHLSDWESIELKDTGFVNFPLLNKCFEFIQENKGFIYSIIQLVNPDCFLASYQHNSRENAQNAFQKMSLQQYESYFKDAFFRALGRFIPLNEQIIKPALNKKISAFTIADFIDILAIQRQSRIEKLKPQEAALYFQAAMFYVCLLENVRLENDRFRLNQPITIPQFMLL